MDTSTNDIDSNRPFPNMNALSNGFRMLLSSYTKGVNKQQGFMGSLFAQNTKSKQVSADNIDDDYTHTCFAYIHQNPLAAGLVEGLEGWEFSSYADYAGIRNGTLCNLDLGRKLLYFDAEQPYVATLLEEEKVAKIW